MPTYVPLTAYANDSSATVAVNGYQGGAATAGAPAAGTAETWTVISSASFPTGIGGTQFHVADPQAPSEIITVTNVAGTTWSVIRGGMAAGIDSTTPVTHAAGATFVQMVTAGDLTAMQYQPWQFPVEAYGAYCDGTIIADAVLASSTTLTSASAAFTTADTGKHIMINGGAGTTSGPLITTITYVNATTVTLGSAASVTGTGYCAIYGTDDTAAINAAMTAAATYALANGYFAEVLFGAKYHILASGPTQTTSPVIYNAQIPIPYPPDLTNAGRKLVIVLTGTGDGGYPQFYESTTPNISGTALISMTTAPGTVSPTYGPQSVIGGPGGGVFTGGFCNVKVHARGLTVVCGIYTNQIAYDFSYLSCMRMERCSAHVFAPTGAFVAGKEPQQATVFPTTAFINALGVGLVSPVAENNAEVVCDDCTIQGYTTCYWICDHFTGTRLAGMYTSHLLAVDGTRGSAFQFPITILSVDAEAYDSLIFLVGGSAGKIPFYAWIATEYSGVANGTSELNDPSNALIGEIHWSYPTGANYAPQITGGAGIKFINDTWGPGVWTGSMTPAVPAAPASGTAQQNTAYRDAALYLNATTITAVYVGPTSASLTTALPGQIQASGGPGVAMRVPAGFWFKATYTGTLTTTWILE